MTDFNPVINFDPCFKINCDLELSSNVKKVNVDSIFEGLSDKDKLEIIFYFYTNSPKREWYYKFFTTVDDTNEVTMFKNIENIFYVFAFARRVIYDMTPLQLFTLIDNQFDYQLLNLMVYASERSYRLNYYSIIFVAFKYGLLEDIDINSILRGDLEEEFNQLLISSEYNTDMIDEINSDISRYEDAYNRLYKTNF